MCRPELLIVFEKNPVRVLGHIFIGEQKAEPRRPVCLASLEAERECLRSHFNLRPCFMRETVPLLGDAA